RGARTVGERPTHRARAGRSGADDGVRLSAGERDHPGHGARRRSPRGAALRREYRRRRGGLSGRRLLAPSGARHAADRHDAGSRGPGRRRPALRGRALVTRAAAAPGRVGAGGRSMLVLAVAVVVWARLSADFLVNRTLWPLRPGEQRLVVSEGITDVVTVT